MQRKNSMNINKIILDVLKDTAQMQEIELPFELSDKSKIIGKEGILDSLAFVTFIISLEKRINEQYHALISLQDEKAFSQTKSPFRSIESLNNYIIDILKEQNKI